MAQLGHLPVYYYLFFDGTSHRVENLAIAKKERVSPIIESSYDFDALMDMAEELNEDKCQF